jgi:DNA invertase Pin-like site-specific DNA recombinase
MHSLKRPSEAARVRAIGLIRVSEPGDRSGETFRSPRDQRAIIERICGEHDWEPTYWMEGLGLSGMLPLDKRSDLLASLGLIQAGRAQVLVSAYYDRMWRKTRVGEDVLDLLEAAGCRVFAGDLGEITRRTAASRFQLRVLGAANELVAESAAEKTMNAKRDAVARGVAPFPTLIAGYRRGEGERIEPDPVTAPLVAQAFQLRADGATILQVRDFLRRSGVLVPAMKRSKDGKHALIPIDHQRTRTLLTSRFVLGELRHGEFFNPTSHEPIVDLDLWNAAQRHRGSKRGRTAKSDLLLARLGVLRCAMCGKPMSAGGYFWKGKRTATYTCNQPDNACRQRVTINADLVDDAVSAQVRNELAKDAGSASAEHRLRAAAATLAEAEQRLANAVEAFTGLEDLDSARARLAEFRDQRDQAEAALFALQRSAPLQERVVRAGNEWNELSRAEQRRLIQLLVPRVLVHPTSAGWRGLDRIEFPE